MKQLFLVFQGIAALIEDFKKRKQPIYFYQPCSSVISIFKGAMLEDFVYVCNSRELDFLLTPDSRRLKDKEYLEDNIDDPKEASSLMIHP